MAITVTKYSIFIASPNDLEEERLAIDDVVNELNKTFSLNHNVILEVIKWERDSAPGITNGSPQNLISQDIGSEYDLFIGLLWKKFGTPTDNAGSGTEEEFDKAYEKFQSDNDSLQVLFYFKTSTPKSLSDINGNELAKIAKFKQSIGEKGVYYWEFDTIENLKGFLRLHIPRRIQGLIQSKKSNETTVLVSIEKEKESEDDDYGIFDYSDQFENLIAESTNSLLKIGESTHWIADELNQKAAQIERISKMPNVNNNSVRDLIRRTAKLIDNYTNRIKTEIPIYYNSFEDALKAGTRLINLSGDFASKDTIENLEEIKNEIFELRIIIPDSLASTIEFHQVVNELPRIQKEINKSKKELLVELEDFIMKMRSSLDLVEEFSNSIGNKIDELKLKSGK